MMTKSTLLDGRLDFGHKPDRSAAVSSLSRSLSRQARARGPLGKVLTIWLVDDDDMVRKLVAELLSGHSDIQCTRGFDSAEAALGELEKEKAPDVILLDANMKGMSGIDAVASIKRVASSTRVFILTTFYDRQSEARALVGGASGFLLKRDPPGEWLAAIVPTPRQTSEPPSDEVNSVQLSKE